MFGKIIISTSIIIILSFFVFVWQSIPKYEGQITLNGTSLSQSIKIYRDNKYGIPHIHSSNLQDGYFGLGYVHAQDRLWQLHIRRMASQGRLSEIFGYKENVIIIDQYIRNLGYLESCKRIEEKLTQKAKQHLQSYADGINEAVKQIHILPIEFKILGIEFQEWKIYDSISFIKLMSLGNINDMFHEFMRSTFQDIYGRNIANILGSIGPQNQYDSNITEILQNEWDQFKIQNNISYDRNKFQNTSNQTNLHNLNNANEIFKIIQEYQSNYLLPTLKASNAWVISGKYTKSGKPHLANDPHLDNNMPSQWYQAEILYQIDNDYNFVIGGTLPGIPFSLSGRSRYLGWGMTTLYSDGGDLYEEEIKEINGQKYYNYNQQWILCRKTTETILIKDSQSINIDIYHTHHGPILQYYIENKQLRNHNGHHYSFQSVIHIDDFESFDGMIEFIKGNNINSSIQQLKNICYPNNAMVFISYDNHIGYLSTGRLVLKEGHPDDNGYVKSNGKEWLRYVPINEIPMIIDPEKGYIIVANNKFIPNSELSWNSQPTSRGRRLNDLISEKINKGEKFELLDHIKLQNDVYDSYACNTKQDLIKLLKIYGQEINIQKSIDILEQWDCKWLGNSQGALLYGIFEWIYSFKFHEKLNSSVLNQWNNHYIFDSFHFKNIESMVNGQNLNEQYCNGNTINNCVLNLVQSLYEAQEYIQSKFGNSTATWNNVHHQHFPHAFSDTPFGFIFEKRIPYSGNRRTPSVSQYSLDGTFDGKTGANYRQIISMDENESNYYILDTGISGNPFSKLYTNQMDLWQEGKYVKMKFGNRTDYDLLLTINI